MDTFDFQQVLNPEVWFTQGRGPRYQQLYRYLRDAITSEVLAVDTQFPPERDMAVQADVSRVTIRKAIGRLVEDGLLDQRQGSGSFVRAATDTRLEQSLSSLVSFTETMKLRGYKSSSRIISAGVHYPTPTEMLALGLTSSARVARVKRLRMADPGALAVEVSSLPVDVLPNPNEVSTSLYSVLRQLGMAPVRAIQRISAVNLSSSDAELLQVPVGTAFLQIDRTGYLANDRPVEFTSGVYRSDIYDFVAELRLDNTL